MRHIEDCTQARLEMDWVQRIHVQSKRKVVKFPITLGLCLIMLEIVRLEEILTRYLACIRLREIHIY